MLVLAQSEKAGESQLILVLDDEVTVTEGLAAGLEREGRTIITCNDVESAQIIVERFHPSHVVADVRISGPFGYEGLDFIRFVKRYNPESRIIMMTGDAPDALQLEAANRGAVAFLKKPFELFELDSVLDLLACSASSSAAVSSRLIRMPLLDEIIESDDLRPFFQPIVALDDSRRIVGFESLARYRSEGPFKNPDVLFRYAARKQRVADLEVACVGASLRSGAALAATAPLFLNVHPQVLAGGQRFAEILGDRCQRNGVPLDQIVVEITEQGSLSDDRGVPQAIECLRNLGVRFALDDVGVAYSHLPLIDKIRPAFLKVSQHFGTGFETDSTKMKIIMNVLSLANDFNSTLILEGIESEATAEMAEQLHIPLGQGFLFSHPADASAFA